MNAWVTHVKTWAAANGKSYGCAMTDPRCKASYKTPATSGNKKAVQTELLSKYPAYAARPKRGGVKRTIAQIKASRK